MGVRLPELAVIFVVALLVFGPKKLPEMGASVGKAINGFKKGMNEFNLNGTDSSSSSHQAEMQALEAKRLELEILERELELKKAQASFQESTHTDVHSDHTIYEYRDLPEVPRPAPEAVALENNHA